MAKKKTALGNDPFQNGAATPATPDATNAPATSMSGQVTVSKKAANPEKPKRPKAGTTVKTKKSPAAKSPAKKPAKTTAAKPVAAKPKAAPQALPQPEQPEPKPVSRAEVPPRPEVAPPPIATEPVIAPAAPVAEPAMAEQVPFQYQITMRKPELGRPDESSLAAPLVGGPGSGNPAVLQNLNRAGDEFGFDPELEQRCDGLCGFLYKRYWRVRVEGAENIPNEGRVILVANHAGILPWDSLMIRQAVLRNHPARRPVRPLIEDFIYYFPYVGTMMSRLGAVRAHQENAQLLLKAEQAILVFPEGIKGVEKPYRRRYQLQRFGRGGFIKLALATHAPIVPVAVLGSEEVNPVLVNFSQLARMLQLPYIPVTPLFPMLGPLGMLPLPSKWQIRFGKPITFEDEEVEDLEDRRLITPLADKVRGRIQNMLDMLLAERRSVWFG